MIRLRDSAPQTEGQRESKQLIMKTLTKKKMEISIEDFNALSNELSRRDVRIATLEMELKVQQGNYTRDIKQMRDECDALLEEKMRLERRVEMLVTDYENMRFENHWMKQFILLSVERVRGVFAHIRDIKMLAAVKTFVLEMMPADASPEQVAFASEAMSLPKSDEKPAFNNYGTYNEVHSGGKNITNIIE